MPGLGRATNRFRLTCRASEKVPDASATEFVHELDLGLISRAAHFQTLFAERLSATASNSWSQRPEMTRIELHLWVAALLQWLVASSNLFAARIFAYRRRPKLSPFVREVFIVQNIYIMTTVAMFGIVSIVFTAELAGGSLGRFLSGFLAIFWGGRIIIQLFFYDREVKNRSRPIANLVFLATFIYLFSPFAWPAVGTIDEKET